MEKYSPLLLDNLHGKLRDFQAKTKFVEYVVKSLRALSTKTFLMFQRIKIVFNNFEKGESVMNFFRFLSYFPADLHNWIIFWSPLIPFREVRIVSWGLGPLNADAGPNWPTLVFADLEQ